MDDGKLYCALMAIKNNELVQNQWEFISERFGSVYFANRLEYCAFLLDNRLELSDYVEYQEFQRNLSVVGNPIVEGAYRLKRSGFEMLSILQKQYEA